MQEEDKYCILISRYLANELSDTETNALLAWANDKPEHFELLQQMQNAWNKSDVYLKAKNKEFDTNEGWEKVENRLFPQKRKPAKVFSLQSSKWIGIAASLLLIIGLGWFAINYHQRNTEILFVNQFEEKQQVLLPDGTIVWLNKESRISYKQGMNDLNLREVTLKGEGFFEVKHDAEKAFIIHSGGTQTQVLGTSFNVAMAKDGSVKVAVVTGKVSFKREDEKEGLFLLPGEVGVSGKAGSISKTEFKNTNFLYWKTKTLNFENERLGQVLADLEAFYKIKFEIKSNELLNKKITTSFQSASIHQVIGVLESVLDVKIEKSKNTYVVVK